MQARLTKIDAAVSALNLTYDIATLGRSQFNSGLFGRCRKRLMCERKWVAFQLLHYEVRFLKRKVCSSNRLLRPGLRKDEKKDGGKPWKQLLYDLFTVASASWKLRRPIVSAFFHLKSLNNRAAVSLREYTIELCGRYLLQQR